MIVQQSGYGHGCPKFWGHGLLPFEELVVMVMITHSHDDHDHDDGDNDYVYTWNPGRDMALLGTDSYKIPKDVPRQGTCPGCFGFLAFDAIQQYQNIFGVVSKLLKPVYTKPSVNPKASQWYSAISEPNLNPYLVLWTFSPTKGW